MKPAAHLPIRLCVGCGGRAPQCELLRITSAPDDTLTIVRRPTGSGRSAYLHRRLQCWERFAARQGPVRSLGRSVDKRTRAALVQELKRVEQSASMMMR